MKTILIPLLLSVAFALVASASTPDLQRDFVQTLNSFKDRYKGAANAIAKSESRIARKSALEQLLPDKNVSSWTGVLKRISTTSAGDATVVIQLDASVSVKTLPSAAFDTAGRIIKRGTPLYQQLSKLSDGSKVVFSGTFVAEAKDYIKEMSITEGGSMTEPEFIMVFSDIRPLE